MPRCAETLVDSQRRVDERGLLHVDADERAEPLGLRDEALEVRIRRLLVERETEVRELESHVRPELLGDEPVEDQLVLRHHCARPGLVGDVLAQQRGVRMHARVVQPTQHGDALVQRLARDEARRPQPHAVPLHKTLQPLAVGRTQDRGARDRAQLHRTRA